MFRLHNEARAKVGVPPLTLSPTLTRAARLRSSDMFSRSYFSHTDPDGNPWSDVVRAVGYCHSIIGENIAWNTHSVTLTTSIAMTGLLNSPGHYANITDARFQQVGIGLVTGPRNNYWTMIFGTPLKGDC